MFAHTAVLRVKDDRIPPDLKICAPGQSLIFLGRDLFETSKSNTTTKWKGCVKKVKLNNTEIRGLVHVSYMM